MYSRFGTHVPPHADILWALYVICICQVDTPLTFHMRLSAKSKPIREGVEKQGRLGGIGRHEPLMTWASLECHHWRICVDSHTLQIPENEAL